MRNSKLYDHKLAFIFSTYF